MLEAGLHKTLETIPRLPLSETPTPLEPLPRLSESLRLPVYVKRDDGLGPGMGGNKIRKLEFLLADALQSGRRKVVTFGGLQSNHARLTAAAARRCGLEPHLFYFERRPAVLKGNLLLNAVLGARLHFFPLGDGGGRRDLDQTIRLVRWVARLRLGPHYFIPVGGHSWLGCLGYVRAAVELDGQIRSAGLSSAHLVLPAGTGGTLAGLLAGFALLKSPVTLTAIDVGKLWRGFSASVARLATQICRRLGSPRIFTAGDIPLLEDRFAGERYGEPSLEGMQALNLAARLEGLVLDPVYTAKAFAGLLSLGRSGEFSTSDPLIFLHTGGAPGLFAFTDGIDPERTGR